MSENVNSHGFMAVLVKPVSEEDYKDVAERLYEEDKNLEINYDGTLVFTNHCDGSEYGISFGNFNPTGRQEFIELCKASGLEVNANTVKPYTCTWYNGSDSDMSCLTKETFLEQTNE